MTEIQNHKHAFRILVLDIICDLEFVIWNFRCYAAVWDN